MADIQSSLASAYDATAAVRANGGFKNWNDAWSNFVINSALSDYEFQNNKEMWNLMNEYNSPSAQMARFKEAGLNPNLIYTQGNPGNASSPVTYKAPTVNFNPRKSEQDLIMQKLNGAMQILGAVNNLTKNIASMYDTGMNVALKKNQLALSDRDVANMQYVFGGDSGSTGMNISGSHLQNALNPWSDKFDLRAFQYLSQHGGLPQFANLYLTSDQLRELNHFRSIYQQEYNEELLPLFKQYQEKKVTNLGLQNIIMDYNEHMLDALPPEIRGFLDPIFRFLNFMMRGR